MALQSHLNAAQEDTQAETQNLDECMLTCMKNEKILGVDLLLSLEEIWEMTHWMEEAVLAPQCACYISGNVKRNDAWALRHVKLVQ